MGLFDYTPYDSSYDYTDSFGGTDDWSLPVGTETGGDMDSLFGNNNWLESFLDNTGDDWSLPVGTETGGDFTTDDLNYGGGSWFDDLFDDTPYSGSSSDFFDTYGDTPIGGGSTSWFDDLLSETEEAGAGAGADSETKDGPLGYGILPAIRNILFGSGDGPLGGNILGGGEGGSGILGAILGLGGQGGGGLLGGGAGGEGGLGSFLSGANPLMQFLMMKSLMKNDGGGGSVPIGGEAYGGPKFNYQDYQPTNLQPALMPGVGYANVRPPDVGIPGMMHGGSTDQRPGDITFAKLEPGEFVIQKPAVDAVGIETLEQINNMGNGRSYNV